MRSCETHLLQFIDDLARGVCDGDQFDLAIMDFSKAFDIVPYEHLLAKLDHYEIRGNTLARIRSFLTNRSQQGVVSGEKSTSAPVTSRVPQGWVLRPILFLAFIKDMSECIQPKCRLFTDNNIIYRPVASEKDCQSLQRDL